MNINEVIPIINDDINIISNTTDFSTETKQDDIISAIWNIKIDTWDIDLNTDWLEQIWTDTNTKIDTLISKDFSTSAKQDVLNTLITNLIWVTNALYDVSTKLNVLSWVTWTVADLRVTPLSLPTLWTVTTVWTLTNQTNIGWFIASTTIQDKMNTNAYLNNISNISSIW